jgi:hypothetical protein
MWFIAVIVFVASASNMQQLDYFALIEVHITYTFKTWPFARDHCLSVIRECHILQNYIRKDHIRATTKGKTLNHGIFDRVLIGVWYL